MVGRAGTPRCSRAARPTNHPCRSKRPWQERALDLLDLCWTSAGPDVPQRNAEKMGTSLHRLDILDFFPGRSRLPVTLAGSYPGRKAESFQRRGFGTSPECPDG